MGHHTTLPFMTRPQRQDVLHSFLQRRVRNSLDLQYAIRASEAMSAGEMNSLRQLAIDVRHFWGDLGASDDEIDHEGLIDFAFDTLQVGFPLTRRHGRLFHREMGAIIIKGLSAVRAEFATALSLFEIPAARFYRVCDLTSGDDILKVIDQVMTGLRDSKNYGRRDDVPAEHFTVHLHEPIHLHPGFRYGTRSDGDKTVFGFEIDLAADIDLLDWKRQIDELQYQYALYRAPLSGEDPIAGELIQDFLEREQEGEHSEFDVPRLDSFLGVLTGLHCWDLYKRGGVKREAAIVDVAKRVGKGEDNVKKNYDDASKRINSMIAKFAKTPADLSAVAANA